MNVIFFIFKLFISPVKTIYSLLTGKKKKTHFLLKPLKIALITLTSIFGISVILAALNEDDYMIGSWRSNGTSITPVEIELDEIDDDLLVNNPNGTVNGLNLQLIDSIKTEGFVKEYLTLARKSQNGELNSYSDHVTIGSIIGLAMGEQGGYPQSGYMLPNTCLPWDSSTKSPKWDKSINATLSLATASVFDRIGMNPATGRVGGYVSPYQQTESYFLNGSYMPSNMLGYGMTAGRTRGDWTYFPDQLTGLDAEVTNVQGLDASRLSTTARAMNASENHNVGPGWKRQFLGVYKNGDYTEGLIQLEKEFSSMFNKYQTQIASQIFDPSYYKWFANFLLMENGWYLTTRDGDKRGGGNTSYDAMSKVNRSVCFTVFKQLGLGNTMEEMQSYLSAHYKNPTDYGKCLNATTQGTIWKDFGADGRMFMLTETAGHILSSSFMGPIYYARMLKYAGVNIDITDPNTYMNTLPEGEWKPSGDSVWMNNYPEIDQSKLNPKRAAFLNEAYKWLGSWYAFGGWNPPRKDANGEWMSPVHTSGIYYDYGFDCSRYIQYCIQQALGIDISRSTYSQLESTTIVKITKEEMKPGDLVYCYQGSSPEHVYIFLGKTSEGYDLMMHAPRTGKRLEIRVMNYASYYSGGFTYHRVKALDE